MVHRAKHFLVALATGLAAQGSAAGARALDCMAQSYGPKEAAEIAALSTGFSFDDGNASSDRLSEIGIAATYECFEEQDWSESQMYYAMLFELGRLGEAAYRQSGRMTAEQLRTLDAALAARERPELWAMMERAVRAGLEDKEAETTPQEDAVMGGFVLSLNIGSPEAVGEKIGELMGAMALQRVGRREFEALSEER
jgi:hypothetical protein